MRLSGMIWMRHNLGADMMANPDVPTQQINGDYYQFGKKTPAANVTTPANSISKWDISSAPNEAWNSGSFLVAVKQLMIHVRMDGVYLLTEKSMLWIKDK